jgi:hypothetical protein
VSTKQKRIVPKKVESNPEHTTRTVANSYIASLALSTTIPDSAHTETNSASPTNLETRAKRLLHYPLSALPMQIHYHYFLLTIRHHCYPWMLEKRLMQNLVPMQYAQITEYQQSTPMQTIREDQHLSTLHQDHLTEPLQT